MRLIDADVLIAQMEADAEHMDEPYAKMMYCAAISDVRHAPTIEPERETGRWIHDGYAFKGGIDWMHCSECGHKDCWSAATRTPFCAWCGARMEEPEDIPMEYFENGGR